MHAYAVLNSAVVERLHRWVVLTDKLAHHWPCTVNTIYTGEEGGGGGGRDFKRGLWDEVALKLIIIHLCRIKQSDWSIAMHK